MVFLVTYVSSKVYQNVKMFITNSGTWTILRVRVVVRFSIVHNCSYSFFPLGTCDNYPYI